jgi:PKD repeat protein
MTALLPGIYQVSLTVISSAAKAMVPITVTVK